MWISFCICAKQVNLWTSVHNICHCFLLLKMVIEVLPEWATSYFALTASIRTHFTWTLLDFQSKDGQMIAHSAGSPVWLIAVGCVSSRYSATSFLLRWHGYHRFSEHHSRGFITTGWRHLPTVIHEWKSTSQLFLNWGKRHYIRSV